jgi:hypothetical protein
MTSLLRFDKRLGFIPGNMILVLFRRGLHKIGRGAQEGSGQTSVQAEFASADSVYDHAGGIG